MKHKHQAYSLYMAIWLMITSLNIAALTAVGERTTIIVAIYWLGLWEEKDEGDEQAVIILADDTPCPFCGKHRLYTQYCPECGHKMVEDEPL